jgi:hypothetical protein
MGLLAGFDCVGEVRAKLGLDMESSSGGFLKSGAEGP